MFLLDFKSGLPIYEQLKNKTMELIMAGILNPGDKMPSVRNLARDLGVNPNTIQKAYQDLEKDGIIMSMGGKGSFICEKTEPNLKLIYECLEKLKQTAYEARIHGATISDCIMAVENIYARGETYD